MKVSRKEVLKIASISRIEVRDDEVEGLMSKLQEVLTYAERVAEVAAVAKEPSVKNVNVFREDVAVQTPAGPILSQAPERAGDYFVVPSILESSQ